MRRISRWMLGMGLFIAAGLPAVEPGHAGDKRSGPHCNLGTLKGRYLFANSGTVLPPAFGVAQPTPAAAAGFHIFNGDGTGTDIVTFHVGTTTVLQNAVFPITYTVNPDCTGTYAVADGPTFDLFIAPSGEATAVIGTHSPAGYYPSSIDPRVSGK